MLDCADGRFSRPITVSQSP